MISKIQKFTAYFGIFLLALLALATPASAQSKQYAEWSESDGRQLGYLVEENGQGKYSTFLGRYADLENSEGLPIWCVNVTHPNPTDENIISVETLTAPTHTAPAGLQVTTAQMAYLMQKYQHSNDPLELAGVAYLVHLNFEQESNPEIIRTKYPNTNSAENLAHLREAILKYADFIETKSRDFVREAIANTQTGYQSGSVMGAGERSGSVYALGVTNEVGNYLAGYPITVTLNGPAVFTETDTQTWSGTTSENPISLDWKATGNGEVSVSSQISTTRTTLTLLRTDKTGQNTVTLGRRPEIDLTEKTIPGPKWNVVFDFQPIGVSHVEKISDAGTFTDTFTASADPTYSNGKWLTLSGAEAAKFGLSDGNVPVIYRATAYFVGATPPSAITTVPAAARKLDSVTVKATGPGEISAKFTAPEPGFATVVWEVRKSEQGNLAELIHADWSDGFGVPEETTSYRNEIEIDTALSIRTTKSGVYFVDDIFVSGFPADHGNFAGTDRFAADVKYLQQNLYFFPAGLAVNAENLAQAELIAANVPVPATNGFHPSVGDTRFKAQQSADGTLTAGTYVFVTSFAGDDRVKPFTTSVSDKTEQYLVKHEPKLHTTLTNQGTKTVPASGTQKLVDHVCYTNLQPQKEYQLRGALMLLPEGKAALDTTGNPISATQTFTPSSANDCTELEFTVDAALFAGKRVVAFERLFENDQEITAHTDLTDQNQTVEFAKPTSVPKPKIPDSPRQTTLPDTGVGNIILPIIFAIAAVGGGTALLWLRRNWKE